MQKDLFDKIVAVLLPEMDDAGARKSLVDSALHGSSVLQKIQWGGAARPFTVRLVRLLDQFGEVERGRSAVVAVLEETRAQVGANRQAQIDVLLAQLKAPTTQPAIRQASSLPKPIGVEKVSLVESPRSEAHTPPTATAAPDLNPENRADRREDSETIPHSTIDTPRWPRKQAYRPRILVMKGGGVKGIAYVGALTALEEYGYRFDHFVGTSAGAISAALLAVGYTSKELGEILEKTDFKKFKDGWLLPSLLLLPIRKGLYRGEAFRVWLENYLRAKFPKYDRAISIKFKHLNETDGTSRRLTVFAGCKDRTAYHFDSTDSKDSDKAISFACRCSMAIPYFFMPEKIDGK